MKVCLLNDSFPPVIDGVANVVVNYANILHQNRLADVVVGTPRYPEASYEQYPYKVIPYQSFDTGAFSNGYRAGNPLAIRPIHSMVDFNPDIIHAHSPFSALIMGRVLRREVNAPVVFTYHTKFDEDIARIVSNPLLQKESGQAIALNISAADEVWVVSNGAGENLKSLGYEGDYRVMANGVDFVRGRATQEAVLAATEGYDLPAGLPVFLFVGRMIRYKGIFKIVEALRILAGKGIDFRMVFVGDGADAEEMKNKVREYGLAKRVIFTGAIHDREVLRAWNTRADLFLFPSTYDTNGIVVREAAACGLASLLITGSCAAEGITDGRNGYMTEDTPEAIASVLQRLVTDPERLRQVGWHAMEEIYISWEQSVKTAHERYLEIIEEWPKRKKGILFNKYPSEVILKLAANFLDETEKGYAVAKALQAEVQEKTMEFGAHIAPKLGQIKPVHDKIESIISNSKLSEKRK